MEFSRFLSGLIFDGEGKFKPKEEANTSQDFKSMEESKLNFKDE